ncbi:S-layer homology domain-containing protein [Paenibacillus sp. UNC451MF]|uniref:S-layer homology domain-containing protein n=1 Tax=Paenibacillus sp. UNC451MF TaxID=1449063 RepID=UPI00069091F5|nr:S-layer homology domain-containing protein [Paenibacillus sp. UNC451MF]
MNNSFKKVMVTGLTMAMVFGGSTAAFADNGKGKGNDKDRGRDAVQTKYNGNGNNKNNDSDIYINNLNVKNMTIKLSFDDVKGADVEWAARYIASLASKRVFEGYEDGTFQPRKTITRIEAITAAVRLMGLRDQAESTEAMNSNLNFKDADKIKQKYPWAVGYVAVALQNDLFQESDDSVQPEKEADRLWATTLLIKALKLQEEAKAKMSTKLSFKDANKIPAGSVGYVEEAIEKQLVDGYEDNTFRPDRSVTRAELAALLDRTGNQLPDNTAISGKLDAAVSNNTLTVTKNGQPYTVELDSNAFIYRNGAKVAASELRAGDQVTVRTYGGKAIFVEVTKAVNDNSTPENTTFSASINATVSNNKLSYTKDNQTYSLEFASNATIVRNGRTVAASELRAGDQVNIRTYNGKIIFVEVTKLADGSQLPDNTTFAATVNAAVSNNTLTLTKDNQTYSAEFASNATIVRNGRTVAATELRAGDQINVRTYSGKIIFVEVTKMAEEQTDFTVIGSFNSYTLNSGGSIATISINQTLSNGTVQTAVYNTASNLTIQGDLSQLTVDRSVELRGKDQLVHTIVIR